MAPTSTNLLNIDAGLIEALTIRLNDTAISPDVSWFESICKYVYEKIKNEDVFLNNFYQSSAYRKLLLELEFCGNMNVESDLDSHLTLNTLSHTDTGSDSNSGDLAFDDEIDFVLDSNAFVATPPFASVSIAAAAVNMAKVPIKANQPQKSPSHSMQPLKGGATLAKTENKNIELPAKRSPNTGNSNMNSFLTISPPMVNTKHCRSQSDCTGIVQNIQADDMRVEPIPNFFIDPLGALSGPTASPPSISSNLNERMTPTHRATPAHVTHNDMMDVCDHQRVSAKIINTAINCEGQFAVYAIHVTVLVNNQQESWHVYRRYSKFLELKKALVKRVSDQLISII